MIINQKALDELTARTTSSPRLRMDLNLRYSPTGLKTSVEDVCCSIPGLRGHGIR